MTTFTLKRTRLTLAGALLLGAVGCGLVDAAGTPRLEAHRFGSGNYPENSRSALDAALSAGYPSLETDLVLTQDLVPVLSHDTWVNPAKCTYAPDSEGAEPRRLPADSRMLIQDLTLEQLQRDYRCGGLGDPAKPEAVKIADTYVTFDEMLDKVKGHPDVLLHLDIKQYPGFTQSEEVFAEQILEHFNKAALPNPFYITSSQGALIKVFKARQPLRAMLIWPDFSPTANTTGTAAANELERKLGFQELIQVTRDADADGIEVSYAVADRAALEAVHQAGLQTGVWAPDTKAQLALFCRWPLDYLITDYVERAPCR